MLAILLLVAASTQAEPDAALPAAPAAQADVVSGTISYQGRLLDGGGNPVNGTPVVTFSLYAQPSGGPFLWRDWFNVTVQDGLFHVFLAPDLDFFDGHPLWLSIHVQGDPVELSPRQQLLPAPYALSLRPGALVNAALLDDPILHLVTPVLAQVSATFDLSWHAIGSGGGQMESAHYTLQGTASQPVVGGMGDCTSRCVFLADMALCRAFGKSIKF